MRIVRIKCPNPPFVRDRVAASRSAGTFWGGIRHRSSGSLLLRGGRRSVRRAATAPPTGLPAAEPPRHIEPEHLGRRHLDQVLLQLPQPLPTDGLGPAGM